MALILQILRNTAIILLCLIMLQNITLWFWLTGFAAFGYYIGRMLLAEAKAAFRQAVAHFCFMLFLCTFAIGMTMCMPYAVMTYKVLH